MPGLTGRDDRHPTATLDGIEDPPDLAAHLLEPRIMLLHPGEGLPDLLPVFFELTLVQGKLVMMPGDDLRQIPNDSGHRPNFSTEVLDTGSHLRELRCSVNHMLTQDPR